MRNTSIRTDREMVDIKDLAVILRSIKKIKNKKTDSTEQHFALEVTENTTSPKLLDFLQSKYGFSSIKNLFQHPINWQTIKFDFSSDDHFNDMEFDINFDDGNVFLQQVRMTGVTVSRPANSQEVFKYKFTFKNDMPIEDYEQFSEYLEMTEEDENQKKQFILFMCYLYADKSLMREG